MTCDYELGVCEQRHGEVRLQVTGDIDMESGPLLLDSIVCAGLAYGPGHRVVVDLAGASWLDSSGVSALVMAHRRLHEQEQQLVLANPSGIVQRVITLVGLDQLTPVEG